MASTETTGAGPLRLWPAVAIVALQWLVAFGSGVVAPGTFTQFFGMMLGPALGLLLLVLWWLFFARLSAWGERLAGLGMIVAALVATAALLHRSMQMLLLTHVIPGLCLALVAAATWARRGPRGRRLLAMAAAAVLACVPWTLMRADGVTGALDVELAWRWSRTAEERYLAALPTEPDPATAAATDTPVAAEWPGFRGPDRDGVISGASIVTDWQASPPELLWKRPVGPGWSSFAVAGDRLFTQEQQGEDEVVSCYDATTGEPIWQHRDQARFWEAMAGAGPRATPSLADGRVYTMGATGILNALRADDGAVVWSRDAAADSAARLPDWGFAGSPLILDDIVVVYTGATGGKGIAAYDRATGEPRWFGPAGALSYSSPTLLAVAGTPQILLLAGEGLTSLAPHDGTLLWEHAWTASGGARVVQPALTADGDLLLGTGFGIGTRRLHVRQDGGEWTVEERWTTNAIKPYYNDFVVHGDHAYGFDGRHLACVRLEDGARSWKGGRYGHGQLVLLADQDLLLVLSEKGEIALVGAQPDGFNEMARRPAIEGKTWNHPVLVDGVLYVRNGQEMAAYRLTLAAPS